MITKKTEITSANILGVEAGTTGYCGGDSGWGGKTFFKIKDLGATDITIGFTDLPGVTSNEGFYVQLGGDCELDTMICALSFILKTLVCQIENIDTNDVDSMIISKSGIKVSKNLKVSRCDIERDVFH